MIKFTRNSDFDFGVESVSIIGDSKELNKRASAKELLKFAKTPNQTDLHIIAVGAYEGTGFNRNGDMFKEADCEKNHHFFKKADRAVHRHHINKPDSPKYGNIKASAYNKKMKRVELILGLDNDKCRDILDEQEKTGNTNWSMGSKQEYDICTWCKHKAHNDEDRCEHIPDKIGDINKLGEMCGMENPNPKWFEMSYVKRPADRIGMSLKLANEACYRPLLTRDFLSIYSGFQIPQDEFYISKKASDKRGLLEKLAKKEEELKNIVKAPKTKSDKHLADHAKGIAQSDSIKDEDMDNLRKHEPTKVFKGMADNGMFFNPEEFVKYLFGGRMGQDRVDGMRSHLPNGFNDALNDGSVVNSEKFEPSNGETPADLKKLVGGMAPQHSLNQEPTIRRIINITIITGGPKDKPVMEEKTKEAADKELAKQYITYKLAALNYLNDHDKLDEDLLINSILQNLY